MRLRPRRLSSNRKLASRATLDTEAAAVNTDALKGARDWPKVSDVVNHDREVDMQQHGLTEEEANKAMAD